jgi:hypothetical protein
MSTTTTDRGVVDNKLAGVGTILYEAHTSDSNIGAGLTALSPCRTIVAVLFEKRLRVYADNGVNVGDIEYDEYHDYSSGAKFLGWSPDATRIAVVNGGFVKFYGLGADHMFVSSKPVAKLALKSKEGAMHVAISARNELFALAVNDAVKVYKFRGEDRHLLLQEIEGHSIVRHMSFSNDNGTLLVVYNDRMTFYQLAPND